MKFSEKYPNAKPGEVINEDALLVSVDEKPCDECGELTRFIDYCGENRLCSEECAYKRWDVISRACSHDEGEEDETLTPVKVILAQPGQPACIVDMVLSLENMQKTVGGMIQGIYPWEDKVALVCNDEGKLLGMSPNRALEDEDGRVYDIVHGTFFICGLSEDNFAGLSDELARKYLKKFRNPQTFVRMGTGQLLIMEHYIFEET